MEHYELTGEARDVFASWRRLGYSEAQALDKVRRSGIVEQQGLEAMFRNMGLSEAEAKVAAQGRGGGVPPADPFEQMVGVFRQMGLSESAARIAAVGRSGSESAARAEFTEAASSGRPSSSGGSPLSEATRACQRFHGMSEAEARDHLKRKSARENTWLGDEAWLRRYVETFADATPYGQGAPTTLGETGRPRTSGNRIMLQESAGSVVEMPPIVARTDELIRQGTDEPAARRQAYREIYGTEAPDEEA